MTRLIFHAGTHKTGTTAIQGVLAENRDLLAERGIYYPHIWMHFGRAPESRSSNAHFTVANAIANDTPDTQAALDRFLSDLREKSSAFDCILLSAETAYRLTTKPSLAGRISDRQRRRAYVERLARTFKDFDSEIVLYFRRPDSFATSLYSENVVRGSNIEFERFLAKKQFRFDYRFQIDLFKEFFPTRSYVYETAASDGLINRFFSDNELGTPPEPEPAPLRVSVSNGATRWIQRANAETKDASRIQRARWFFALQPENRALFGHGPTTFWNSVEQRDAFVEQYTSDVFELTFPACDPQLPPLSTWSDAEHDAANEAFKNWMKDNRSLLRKREMSVRIHRMCIARRRRRVVQRNSRT
ncbi:MAG: hypothetical protein AAFX39_04235, partial [Pseudomonadota bacterium]